MRALVIREIAQAGGWISFARYMELALYAPGLGYYSAGSAKLGSAGDFVTAPEISSLFGATLATQLADCIGPALPDILELGAGTGKLAGDVLHELARLDKLPRRYLILELSGDLRERQRLALERCVPQLLDRVQWLDTLPQKFCGSVIGNELVDALPVHLVTWSDDGVSERGVALDANGGFVWAGRPATGVLLATANRIRPSIGVLPSGIDYVSEINLAASALIATLAGTLEQGLILLIDYGFPRHEYYHTQRSAGTLMCHYRHRAHDDPFQFPGLQDITAHVDFTALRDAATVNGLECLGFVNQAQFLINCGITDVLARVPPDDVARYLPLAAGAQKLLSPSEMGELFKVIAFGKGIAPPLRGFATGDMHERLG